MSPSEHILRVSDVSIQFGGVRALADVSFHVEKGQVFSIIGPSSCAAMERALVASLDCPSAGS